MRGGDLDCLGPRWSAGNLDWGGLDWTGLGLAWTGPGLDWMLDNCWSGLVDLGYFKLWDPGGERHQDWAAGVRADRPAIMASGGPD